MGSIVQPRFCVLMAGHAPEYVQRVYGGLGSIFVRFLSDPGETWDLFSPIDGHFPTEEQLENYDGFVVTGSKHDAHSDEEWILKLCQLIQQIHKLKKKLLGICFGHQVLCRALGGKTGRAPIGWEVGIKEIIISKALLTKPYGAELPSSINVIEIHQDQVFEMPPGGELLASSEQTGIEIIAVGEHVLGIQGHPEYTGDIMLNILEACCFLGMITEELIKQAKASMENMVLDQQKFQWVCKTFLKGYSSIVEIHNCVDSDRTLCLNECLALNGSLK